LTRRFYACEVFILFVYKFLGHSLFINKILSKKSLLIIYSTFLYPTTPVTQTDFLYVLFSLLLCFVQLFPLLPSIYSFIILGDN